MLSTMKILMKKVPNFWERIYSPNWPEEVFVISKIKNTVPSAYVVNDLNGEEIVVAFYEKELQKINQKDFRIDTSNFALKINIASFKTEVDKLDINKCG